MSLKITGSAGVGVLPSPKDAAPSDFDVSAAAHRLIGASGDSSMNALQTVIIARDGDPGQKVTPAEQRAALQKIQQTLGLAKPLTAEQLRDLDHFLTAYHATHNGVDSFAPASSDGRLKQVLKTIGREVMGVGTSVDTIAYSAAKAISQTTGVDLLSKVSPYSGNGPNTSPASVHEVVEGLKGVIDGAFDPDVDKE